MPNPLWGTIGSGARIAVPEATSSARPVAIP